MSSISKMIFPMMILLLAINASVMMISSMPSNTTATETYGTSIGLTDNQLTSIRTTMLDINSDANALIGTIDQDTSVWVSSTEPETPTGFFEPLFGAFGAGYLFLGLTYNFFFGFVGWIDYFLPTYVPTFFWLGLILKSVFLIVQVAGIITVVSLIIGVWRGSK